MWVQFCFHLNAHSCFTFWLISFCLMPASKLCHANSFFVLSAIVSYMLITLLCLLLCLFLLFIKCYCSSNAYSSFMLNVMPLRHLLFLLLLPLTCPCLLFIASHMLVVLLYVLLLTLTCLYPLYVH